MLSDISLNHFGQERRKNILFGWKRIQFAQNYFYSNAFEIITFNMKTQINRIVKLNGNLNDNFCVEI